MRAIVLPALLLLAACGDGVPTGTDAAAPDDGNLAKDASSPMDAIPANDSFLANDAQRPFDATTAIDATPGPLAGRSIPSPVYGVTLDDVTPIDAEVASLSQLVHTPTTRVVFDLAEPASYYASPIAQLRPVTFVMGELVDSSDMPSVATPGDAMARAQAYTTTLGAAVDVWEIGNEVNGNWLATDTQDTLGKVEAMYDVVASQGGTTSLTFFYEGEPAESSNCIATDHGGADMFGWITTQLDLAQSPSLRPVAGERLRTGVDWVLVSWYPDQCPGETPDWPTVFTRLASIFPQARLGFGELGTQMPQGGSQYEQGEINTYYPLAKSLSLPQQYLGGYFWWYYAEEMVPTSKTGLFAVLNQAIQ